MHAELGYCVRVWEFLPFKIAKSPVTSRRIIKQTWTKFSLASRWRIHLKNSTHYYKIKSQCTRTLEHQLNQISEGNNTQRCGDCVKHDPERFRDGQSIRTHLCRILVELSWIFQSWYKVHTSSSHTMLILKNIVRKEKRAVEKQLSCGAVNRARSAISATGG